MQFTDHEDCGVDLIVVGAGLAGLFTAAIAARAGMRIVVLERSKQAGGRAATQVEGGIHFNLGPHALYCRGEAHGLLGELEIGFTGAFPAGGGAVLTDQDRRCPLPRTFRSVIASRFLTFRDKVRLLRLFGNLARIEPESLDRVSFGDWLRRTVGEGNANRFMRTLCRVATYVADHERLSAGAAIRQLQLAIAGNVLYLDGGWQSLVDGLREGLASRGADVRTGSRVRAVRDRGEFVSVELATGETMHGRTAVLAVDPRSALDLLDLPPDSPLSAWNRRHIPVKAACLDVALSRLPQPSRLVAFGLEAPLYYSVHSASARLAPPPIAVLHVMKYLHPDAHNTPAEVEAELERYLDALQPGWRDLAQQRRFLPGLTVTHGLPCANDGGLAGRPGVDAAGAGRILLAGDWVGPVGMLADASAASAREAARRLEALLSGQKMPLPRSVCHATAG